jgi:hypothetical protein
MFKHNKGSIGISWVTYFWSIFITSILIVFIFLVVVDHRSEEMDVAAIQQRFLFDKIINTKECLASDIGNQPWIDISKIQESRLTGCAYRKDTGYKLTLKDLDGIIISQVKVANGGIYDEATFGICETIAEKTCTKLSRFVKYSISTGEGQGILDLEVITLGK